jgi:hypothetical protein
MARKKAIRTWTKQELQELEAAAIKPVPAQREGLNPHATVPYGCTVEHIFQAMVDFLQFLAVVNEALRAKHYERIESILMAANFSGIVSDFLATGIPKHCKTLVKNDYHNGHPDLLPAGVYLEDSIRYGDQGIELKASRYGRGWQGHNPENTWLMVFVFESSGPRDHKKGIEPRPFRFRSVFLGQLTKQDWRFSGRKGASRRTITASVTRSGFEKMTKNWSYREVGVVPEEDLRAAVKKMEEESE